MSASKSIAGLLLLLAIAVGGWVYQFKATRQLRQTVALASMQMATRDRQRETDQQYAANLEREAAELTVALKQQRVQAETPPQLIPAPPIAHGSYAVLAKINQDRLANVLVTAVVNGRVSSGFIQLFELTKDEAERLNDVLHVTRTRLDQALPPAQRVRVENGYIIVELPAFNAGDEIRSGLLEEFRGVLGDSRYAALEATKGFDSIDRAFEGFGSSSRQITISRIPEGRPGGPGFRLMDGRITAGGSSSAKEVTFTDPAALPAPYAWLAAHLPPLDTLPAPSGRIQLTPSIPK